MPLRTQVLLLGFGDLRNALATTQDWASQPSTKLQTLELVLNDISLLNVARGVLLAHLVGRSSICCQSRLEQSANMLAMVVAPLARGVQNQQVKK